MKWSKETIEEYLKQNPQIKTRTDLKNIKSKAYETARRLNLLEYFFGVKKTTISWTPEKIREFVNDNNIKTRGDLEKLNQACYNAARRQNLLDELFGEKEERKYNWKDENTIYEFLKDHPQIRTRMDLRNACPTAYKVARIAGILDDICENDRNTWNELTIREFVESHPDIDTRSKFKTANGSAFIAAKRLGLLQELFGDPIEYKSYTEEEIIEYMKEHPEITSRKELKEANPSIHLAAQKKHMLNDFFGERVYTKKYNRQNIEDYLKEHPEITTRSQLQNSNKSLYEAARQLNIFNELFGDPVNETWTKEKVYDFITAHPEIISRNQLYENYIKVYQAALRLNLLDELFGEKLNRKGNIKRKRYTKEEIIDYLKKHPEIKFRTHLKESNSGMYDDAKELNIIDDIFGTIHHWTKEEIIDYLKKHPEIKTRKQLQDSNSSIYVKALRLNIFDELFGIPHIITKEEIIDYLKNHKGIFTRTQFLRSNSSMYYRAKKLDLLDELFGEKIYIKHPGYAIYVYEIPDLRYAYVGLTSNYIIRDKFHKNEKFINGDTLQKFCKEHNILIPEMKLLFTNLNQFEAIECERDMWLYYKNNGWNLINSESALGMLGATVRWNIGAIKKFLERHPDIKNEEQFQEANKIVYNAAKRLNIIQELF